MGMYLCVRSSGTLIDTHESLHAWVKHQSQLREAGVDLSEGVEREKVKQYIDAPNPYDVTETRTTTTRRQLEDGRSDEEKAAAKKEEAEEKERALAKLRLEHRRRLENEKATVENDIAGLQEDDHTRRRGITIIFAFGLFSLVCLLGGATAYMFPTDFFWGFTMLGFVLGAVVSVCTGFAGMSWVQKYHGGVPPNVTLARRRQRLTDLKIEISEYTDIPEKSQNLT